MSILIRDMAMPNCCTECEWHEYYGGDYDWVHACIRTGTMPIENAETERANDCPLVEIPGTHGRLIDVDAIDYRNYALHDGRGNLVVGDSFTCGVVWVNDCINNTPTIIEAEGEG